MSSATPLLASATAYADPRPRAILTHLLNIPSGRTVIVSLCSSTLPAVLGVKAQIYGAMLAQLTTALCLFCTIGGSHYVLHQ
jgi:hypothetical protein